MGVARASEMVVRAKSFSTSLSPPESEFAASSSSESAACGAERRAGGASSSDESAATARRRGAVLGRGSGSSRLGGLAAELCAGGRRTRAGIARGRHDPPPGRGSSPSGIPSPRRAPRDSGEQVSQTRRQPGRSPAPSQTHTRPLPCPRPGRARRTRAVWAQESQGRGWGRG